MNFYGCSVYMVCVCVHVAKRHFSFQNHETYKNFCTVWKLHTLSCSLYLYMYMYMYMYVAVMYNFYIIILHARVVSYM